VTAERRLQELLRDPKVETVHLSSALRRALGISKKAADRHPRLRAHRGLPGAVMIAIRRTYKDNVVVLAYDEPGEAFAREFARRPDWGRLAS
jgi:hypothetical protein